MPRPVIHQHVRINYVLVSTKHNLAGRNKWEVLLQPLILSIERRRHLHGGAGDVNIVIPRQLQQCLAASLNELEVGKKSFLVANTGKHLPAIVWDRCTQPLARDQFGVRFAPVRRL